MTIRSGKVLSAANAARLQQAARHLEAAASRHAEATRCLRDVLEAADLDEDSQDVQTSAGTADSTGSAGARAMSFDARRRRLRKFLLADPC